MLTPAIPRNAPTRPPSPLAATITTLRRDHGDIAQFTRSIAEACTSGVDLDWSGWFAGHPASVVELPTYAFQRDHFWLVPAPASSDQIPAATEDDRPSCYRAAWVPTGFNGTPALNGSYLILVPDSLPDHPAVAMVEHAVTTHGATAHVHRVDPLAERAALAEQLTSLSTAHEPTAIISLLALDTTAHPGYPAIPSGLAATITLAQAHADTHPAGADAATPPLWCLTQGAVATSAADPLPHPLQAMAWGAGPGRPPCSIHVCGAA